MRLRFAKYLLAFVIGALGLCLIAETRNLEDANRKSQKVGQVVHGETLVATGQEVVKPPKTIIYGARPVDMVLSHDGTLAYVKDTQGLTVVDLSAMKVVSQTRVKSGASLCGLALSTDGALLAYTDAADGVELFRVDGSEPSLVSTIKIPAAAVGGAPYPCGVAFSQDSSRLFVALNRANSVAEIDVPNRTVLAEFAVDIAPFSVATEADGHLLVTCWAASPRPGSATADSSGTKVEVDSRGIGTAGTLCDLDLASGKVVRRMPVGLQPTDISVDGSHAYVASSNSDQVFDVDLGSWLAKPETRLEALLPGSAPSSVSSGNGWLYAACGGRNVVIRKRLGTHVRSLDFQEARTPWYPIAVRAARGKVIVACSEGLGMRLKSSAHAGWNSYDFEGSISILDDSTRWRDPQKDPNEGSPKHEVQPAPVPLHSGEASAIQHVVYILKENRTYDQVLGDIGKGDSDPSLTIFGNSVTPNQHELANEFVLLDNYYCNGVLSADGHAWAMEGNATTYFQRSFGGWTRSYPFGDDPLSVSRSGFIWDNVLDHGLTVRNFGEFDYATPTPAASYKQILRDFESGSNKIGYRQNIGVGRLRADSQPGYPGWNLGIPDVVRASKFIQDLARMEREKNMPNFVIVYLPQDHTSGGGAGAITPRAQVADNDLAVGRVVEAISKSSFWPHTAIFVNEDDPQAGFDHVDGHRSMCLVVSPYVRRHTVVSEFYNQTSVLRTIEHMLGLPPMNRFDASSPLMTACFERTPDLTPFTAVPNQIPLDETAPAAGQKVALKLDKPDSVDEDLMNRLLWKSSRGSAPYPARYAGAHGLGLRQRGLRLGGDD